uniref:PWWP domain-containing protein n=1 Tax=Gadus morhua TaxID=8049 RepID=A0A8C5BRP9_GADMO
MAGGASTRYKLGDLVFAKMRGFPHWPARKMIGILSLSPSVVPYAGNQAKYGKGVRIRGFTEGMWEIQNTPGVESKQKVPSHSLPIFICLCLSLSVSICPKFPLNSPPLTNATTAETSQLSSAKATRST